MKKSYRIYSVKQMVHYGPSTKFPVVEAFPAGLPRGTSVGVDNEERGWGRLIGTDWWVYIGHAEEQ